METNPSPQKREQAVPLFMPEETAERMTESSLEIYRGLLDEIAEQFGSDAEHAKAEMARAEAAKDSIFLLRAFSQYSDALRYLKRAYDEKLRIAKEFPSEDDAKAFGAVLKEIEEMLVSEIEHAKAEMARAVAANDVDWYIRSLDTHQSAVERLEAAAQERIQIERGKNRFNRSNQPTAQA